MLTQSYRHRRVSRQFLFLLLLLLLLHRCCSCCRWELHTVVDGAETFAASTLVGNESPLVGIFERNLAEARFLRDELVIDDLAGLLELLLLDRLV